MKPLKFKKNDFNFIMVRYPDLYKEYKDVYVEGDFVYVPLPSYSVYDKYSDITVDTIADSIDNYGELTKDGLRLEEAWIYADWSED